MFSEGVSLSRSSQGKHENCLGGNSCSRRYPGKNRTMTRHKTPKVSLCVFPCLDPSVCLASPSSAQRLTKPCRPADCCISPGGHICQFKAGLGTHKSIHDTASRGVSCLLLSSSSSSSSQVFTRLNTQLLRPGGLEYTSCIFIQTKVITLYTIVPPFTTSTLPPFLSAL